MRPLPTLLALVSLASLAILPACPRGTGGSGPGGAGMPAAVSTYPALRWVPADAAWVVTGRTGADLSLVLRDLAEVVGIAGGFSATDVSGASRQQLGYDLLSPDSLASVGVDVSRGAALFGTSLSVTAVAALGDADRFDAFIDEMRTAGFSIQSQVAQGVEVYTVRMRGDVTVSWAIVDGWILSRLELGDERHPELAWFEAAVAARGAFAGTADLGAALEAAAAHAPAISAGGGPPVVGVAYPARLLDAIAKLEPGARDAVACLAPAADARRVLLAAGSGDTAASGALVADVADPSRWAAVPAPGGWYGLRDGAPVQLDVGLDLPAFAATLRGCRIDLRALSGARTFHVAAHAFDRDGFPTRAAAYADLTTDRALRAMLDGIPGLSHVSKQRQVGGVEVVDVSPPFGLAPDFTYHLGGQRAAVALGAGVIEAVLGAGAAPAGELFHLDLRPHDVPDAALHLLLEQGLGVASWRREAMIRQLRVWSRGQVDVRVDGARIVLTATGTRHRARLRTE